MQQFEVSREDDIFEGHPWGLVRTQSDRLVCFFQEETHHGSQGYRRGVYTVSDDRGRTWSDKRPLTEPCYYYQESDDPRRMVGHPDVLEDGRIVAITQERYRYFDESKPMDNDSYLWISEDEADSWQGPKETPIEGDSAYFVELSGAHHDNRWLVVTSNRVRPFDERHDVHHRVETYLSDDEGDSWSGPHEVVTNADHPIEGHHEHYFNETSVVEMPEGELVAFVREGSNQGLDLFKAVSEDGGETWEGPYTMPIPAPHKPMGGMLNSGRVMVTYRFVQGGDGPFWGAQNTFAALTDVESCLATERHDAQANILPLDHDTAVDSDSGYTDWVQFDDGEIYAVNYTVDGTPPRRTREPPGYEGEYEVYPRARIRGYSFSEDEFMGRPIPREVAENHPSGEDAVREWADRTGYDIGEE
jgi:sialidase-1